LDQVQERTVHLIKILQKEFFFKWKVIIEIKN
jgi:hypothetical protein